MAKKDDVLAETQAEKTKGAPSAEIKYWLDERTAALEREKDYRSKARNAIKIYEGDDPAVNSYNILFANTETLQPALYSRLPRPVVRPRPIGTKDPIRVAAASLIQSELKYFENTDLDDYAPFDDLMEQAVLDALVPARGITRFKYDAKVEKDAKGNPVSTTSEIVCGESIPWDRYLQGYAKQWKEVPWVSYDHYMNADELVENFGQEVAGKVQFGENERDSEDGKDGKNGEDGDGKSSLKLCLVVEIWNKRKKEQLFITPNYTEGVLRRTPDPLGLTGFFPQPEPLRLIRKVKTQVPTLLFTQYEQQALELNRICQRINAIVNAMKVRGIYDGRIKELERVFDAGDNEMIAAESMEALGMDGAGGGGLDKAIWMMPLDKLISVLQQLFLQRQQTKMVIHELTGIADIMRGSSAASETLGAQQIKERWGGVRLKRMQRRVARYINDSQRIIAEVCTKLGPETVKSITGIPYPTAQEKAAAQQIIQASVQAKQPPPPDAQKIVSLPSIEELLNLLKSDQLRSYSIDIETNSTVELELTEDKQDISEMMTAMGQFLNGIGPLVQEGALPFDGAKGMLLAISRRFRFGEEVEDILRGMQAPKPPDDGKKAELQATMQEAAAKMQMEQQRFQAEQHREQQKLQMEQARVQFEQQMAQQKAAHEAHVAQQKLENDFALGQQKIQADAMLQERKMLADQQMQEKDAQRQRAIDKKKDEREAQQAEMGLVKELSEIVGQYQKTATEGAAMKDQKAREGQQAAATEKTMTALIKVVEKLAEGQQMKPAAAAAKTITLTKSGDTVRGEIKAS